MTWTRNGHPEFIRVARVPRANGDRAKPPAFGPVRSSRIGERLCDRCPNLFKINSCSAQKLCPSCAVANELAQRARVQYIRDAMVAYEAEREAAGLSPYEELQRVWTRYRLLHGVVQGDTASTAAPPPDSRPLLFSRPAQRPMSEPEDCHRPTHTQSPDGSSEPRHQGG